MQASVENRQFSNPAGWPEDVLAIFERSITTEYASMTARGKPVTYPVTPYVGKNGRTLDVSTGLTYPSKADRARRNPKVALLFSDPVGSGLTRPPVVLVQGMAAVRDADLQENTDRYIRLGFEKLPQAYAGTPGFLLRQMQWYFVRIWVEVTPLRIWWWPEGNLDHDPQCWEAPAGTDIPASDPAPQGRNPTAWMDTQPDWRAGASYAIRSLGDPVLTVVDDQGFPKPMRVCRPSLSTDGLRFDLHAGTGPLAGGPACLTFHSHPEVFTGQQNMVFTGQVERSGSGAHFIVEKQLGDFSLAGSKLQAMWNFMSNGRKLAPRLREEATRRGQKVPKINLPK